MGLAPYGKPLHMDKLRQILKLNADGSFALDLSYFTYMHNEKCMYSDKLIPLPASPARVASGSPDDAGLYGPCGVSSEVDRGSFAGSCACGKGKNGRRKSVSGRRCGA